MYSCSYCRKKFKSRKGLSLHFNHFESHRGNSRIDSPISPTASSPLPLPDNDDWLQLPDDSEYPDSKVAHLADEGLLSDDDYSSDSTSANHIEVEFDSDPDSVSVDVSSESSSVQDESFETANVFQNNDVNGDDSEVTYNLSPRKLAAASWIDEEPDDKFSNYLLENLLCDRRDSCNIPSSIIAEIGLLQTLGDDKGSCPTGLFDKLAAFHSRNIIPGENSKLDRFRRKKAVLQDLKHITNMTQLEPFSRSVTLPETGMVVDVPVFDMKAVIYDLLSSPHLDSDNSYIFKTDNPLDNPSLERYKNQLNSRYDDFDSGSRYVDCFNIYQKEPEDLPLPLVLFIDSANVTWNDRISVEAVMVQLGIHNRETRYSDKSFRNLGIIPKLPSRYYKGKDSGLKKMKDYHIVLQSIMSELHQLNQSGLKWIFRWRGRLTRVVLRPYILAILGDYPGHNMVCGKMGGNNKPSKCRTCTCPNDFLSGTETFPYILKENYVGDHLSDLQLSTISMHRIDNSIEDLPYGDCRFGVCGLCHGETVHIIQGGIEDRLLEGLQQAPIMKPEASRAEREQFKNEGGSWYARASKRIRIETVVEAQDTDSSEGDTVPENKISNAKNNNRKNLCLGGGAGRQFDAIGSFIASSLKNQSNRDLPPMPHSKGITNSNKTTSSEKQGLLLLYLLVFCTTYGQKVFSKRMGAMKMAYTIEVIELVICFEEMCKDTRGIPSELIPKWTVFWKKFKPLLCYITNRNKGDGNNLIKLHMIDHLPLVTEMYGSPANISGGPGENNQKIQKAAGRRTQMNESLFPIQQSRKLFEMTVLQNAIGMMELQQTGRTSLQPSERKPDSEKVRSPKFRIIMNDHGNFTLVQSNGSIIEQRQNTQAGHLIRYAKGQWNKAITAWEKQRRKDPHVARDKPVFIPIIVYTELRKTEDSIETLYRSDCDWQPHYRKDKFLRERCDWAMMRWELKVEGSSETDQYDIPAKLLGFFVKTKDNLWMFDDDEQTPLGAIHVLIHSLTKEPNNYFDVTEEQIPTEMAHPSSRLIFKGQLEMDLATPTLPLNSMIPSINIVGTATVIQDLHPVFRNRGNNIESLVQPKDPGHEHLFIRDRRQWSEVIQAVMSDAYSRTKTVFPIFE